VVAERLQEVADLLEVVGSDIFVLGVAEDKRVIAGLHDHVPVVALFDRPDLPEQGEHLTPLDVVAQRPGQDVAEDVPVTAAQLFRSLSRHGASPRWHRGLAQRPSERVWPT